VTAAGTLDPASLTNFKERPSISMASVSGVNGPRGNVQNNTTLGTGIGFAYDLSGNGKTVVRAASECL